MIDVEIYGSSVDIKFYQHKEIRGHSSTKWYETEDKSKRINLGGGNSYDDSRKMAMINIEIWGIRFYLVFADCYYNVLKQHIDMKDPINTINAAEKFLYAAIGRKEFLSKIMNEIQKNAFKEGEKNIQHQLKQLIFGG